VSDKPQAFATLKLTEKNGVTCELIAEFRGSQLAVAANAMVDQDITKMEFLNGLIVLSLVMDEKGTYKTGKIISGN
jgi:hypothetical protein